jgi:hypothetical protein
MIFPVGKSYRLRKKHDSPAGTKYLFRRLVAVFCRPNFPSTFIDRSLKNNDPNEHARALGARWGGPRGLYVGPM